MFDMAATTGVGVLAPTTYQICNPLLKLIDEVPRTYINCLKVQWKEYRCTVLLDRWMTPTKITCIICLVYCDGIIVFMSTVCIKSELQDHMVI